MIKTITGWFARFFRGGLGAKPGRDRLNVRLVYQLNPKKLPSPRQLKHLGKVLKPQERRLLQILVAVLAVAVVALGITYYLQNFEELPAPGGEYTEALIGAPRFINPLLSQTNDVDTDLSRLIFAGLLRYDRNLQIVPDLAESWSASDDQKIYTFKLRPNLTWHDDAPLTADDVVFTIHSIQDAKFKSPLLVSFRGVAVEKIDDATVRFNLPEPYPQFLEALTVGLLPEHLWGEIPPVNANLTAYNLKPIGAGAWKFKSFVRDELGNIKSMLLEHHENFPGAKPYLERLTFKFYPDFDTAVAAVKMRAAQGISFLPKQFRSELQGLRRYQLYSFPFPQFTAVFFNQKEHEAFRDKNVRTALALAIDKNQILSQALQLEGQLINGPLLPETLGQSTIEPVPADPQKANELLEKAGWKKITAEEYAALQAAAIANQTQASSTPATADGTSPTSTEPDTIESADEGLGEPPYYRKKGSEILKIVLTTVNQPENRAAAELVAQAWNDIGVRVELNIVEGSRIIREVIKPRDYQALLFGEIVGPDADPYPFWHSSQNQDPGLNLAVFANRTVDKLLEEARTAKTPEERQKKYTEFQNIIVGEVPAVFLYMPTYTYVVDNDIKGVGVDRVLVPADRFNSLSNWYIKTKRVLKQAQR